MITQAYSIRIAAAAITLAAMPAQAQSSADKPLVQLMHAFIDAEQAFDQQRLATLITNDYVEISPIGDLDPRATFLGFYAADKKVPFPQMNWSAPMIRHWGDTASLITTVSFDRPAPAGQPAQRAKMSVNFLAVRQAGQWKIASAQFTPQRATPAPAAKPTP
jgi:ketosteroid isomerase-like protein